MTRCKRCGDPCQPQPKGASDARPFRRAAKGNCAACAVCVFFQDEKNGIGHALGCNFDPEGLRLPHIQQQFARVLAVGGSELKMEEIDWDQVIRKWRIGV